MGLIGKKIGMTQIFNEVGHLMPVTVIQVEPNTVVALKNEEKFGYSSVVLGLGELKEKHTSKPYAGQFTEGVKPLRLLKEFRGFEKEVKVGDKLGVELFEKVSYLDVTAISKGKGFQGVMKRWGYGGGRASHGSKFHREAGSTGQCTTPGRSFKNTTMPGRMGSDKVTVQNLQVVKIDPELGVVMVRGSVPGKKDATVFLKSAVKRAR
ncbi:50S ribosomal protein L3 [Treponema pedis]|uniref:50S ribosomal protein L3 n=1 Tax=Treponema pedis TaxID=409322 RepID=UPI00049425E5|nr:50S ribosomal protein L3 [Treponema pedis]